MIIAAIRMVIHPDKQSEFVKTVRGALEPMRYEPGCKSVRLYEDLVKENTFTFLEMWETEEDLQDHIRTEDFRMILQMMDMSSMEAPEIEFHKVEETSGMETIGAALRKCS